MILQVTKLYAPELGGIETVVKQFSEFLSNFDEVVVLCVHKNFNFRTTVEKINNVTVYRCTSLGTYMSMPLSISFFWHLFRLAKKADIIHFHEPFPLGSIGSLLVPKSKRIFVYWHSDIIRQKTFKKIAEFFQKKLCKNAEIIMTSSMRMVEFSPILRKFREKIKIVPLSIKKEDYLISITEDKLGSDLTNLPSDYVLFLGRLSYYKGIDVLLKAIEIVDKRIPFVIAGEGELSKEIKESLKKANGRIYFINRKLSEEEKKYLLKNSKFLVFPSTFPSEAFGIVQLEAMVYGKPVINTNLPTGVPWVSLHGESGLTVEVGDFHQLAKSIEKLYFNKELYESLSKGALKRFEELFEFNKVKKLLYEIYFTNFKSF